MPRAEFAAYLQDVEAADNVRVDISPRIFKAVSNAGLSGQMDDQFGSRLFGDGSEPWCVLQHAVMGAKAAELLELRVPILLELDVIVWRHPIDTGNLVTLLE